MYSIILKALAAQRNAERISWLRVLYRYIFTSAKTDANGPENCEHAAESKEGAEGSTSSKPKTPFTKLSSFKFKKELGRGAFGRYIFRVCVR